MSALTKTKNAQVNLQELFDQRECDCRSGESKIAVVAASTKNFHQTVKPLPKNSNFLTNGKGTASAVPIRAIKRAGFSP
jgi:hypothetical protein